MLIGSWRIWISYKHSNQSLRRPVYSRSFEGVISRKYGEISWNLPIISPSFLVFDHLSHPCHIALLWISRHPWHDSTPATSSSDGNIGWKHGKNHVSLSGLKKKTQDLEDVQVLTGQKNRKLENLQSTGVYQGVGKGAKMSAHSSSLRKNTENDDKSM